MSGPASLLVTTTALFLLSRLAAVGFGSEVLELLGSSFDALFALSSSPAMVLTHLEEYRFKL
jgi:hypothetical protein